MPARPGRWRSRTTSASDGTRLAILGPAPPSCHRFSVLAAPSTGGRPRAWRGCSSGPSWPGAGGRSRVGSGRPTSRASSAPATRQWRRPGVRPTSPPPTWPARSSSRWRPGIAASRSRSTTRRRRVTGGGSRGPASITTPPRVRPAGRSCTATCGSSSACSPPTRPGASSPCRSWPGCPSDGRTCPASRPSTGRRSGPSWRRPWTSCSGRPGGSGTSASRCGSWPTGRTPRRRS
jgi:hypothetical protein